MCFNVYINNIWKRLFAITHPANKNLFAASPAANKNYWYGKLELICRTPP